MQRTRSELSLPELTPPAPSRMRVQRGSSTTTGIERFVRDW